MKTATRKRPQASLAKILGKNTLKLTLAGIFIGYLHSEDGWVALFLASYLVYTLTKRWQSPAADRQVYLTGAILSGVLGVCCELWGIYFGYWEYHDLGPDRSFPFWLPFAWALAFTFIYQLEKDLFLLSGTRQLSVKIIITLLVAMIFPTYGEIITINMGVWTYFWPYQILGVPLLAIGLLVIFHSGLNFLMVLLCRKFGWKNEVFNP
ncbi:hypothetical protein SAMN04488057_103328 [Cyclobacterium lianum]|uniref:CAAX protease self-immunity n=1 Tax=Cyclobacterium lianum TaxID=388280 RepID=A0A1M7LL16_9BACT|nr:hypothetical protein [Cyclobacterium lianum]SHM78825.1 hypothetical protein SAMN04488057_103328 [Cyclobacterium lianum]